MQLNLTPWPGRWQGAAAPEARQPGARIGERAQRDPAQDGTDWGQRLGGDHRAARPGADVEPQIVKKRQWRLTGVDEVVLSLYAKGLTTGETSAHFAEIYGAPTSRETVSRMILLDDQQVL